MKKLTRRTLISLAALLPVIQVEAASSERFDVIVVGAGIAGLAAAVSAAESGAKRVLVLGKGPMIGRARDLRGWDRERGVSEASEGLQYQGFPGTDGETDLGVG